MRKTHRARKEIQREKRFAFLLKSGAGPAIGA
jgi:hypothetical protein